MGCDAFANENGEFELVVTDWENTRPDCKGELGRIKVKGLRPKQKIGIQLIKGEYR